MKSVHITLIVEHNDFQIVSPPFCCFQCQKPLLVKQLVCQVPLYIARKHVAKWTKPNEWRPTFLSYKMNVVKMR